MYGNTSKPSLAGAAVLPATGGIISPWIAVAGYVVLAVTLVSFYCLWRATKKIK
ncbi:LPXTG cell wall anchor domain-containing protein [Lacticaseibacillus kribbianus]|uniref:LPXTG cell wall anchor domain-containing protein n=1 Tax=Lacticaseibacillus kribbianus TaxID=2926292 RepID=UPI001CD2F24C|nr:LPXTG cell wall anchor domain-containing protein [Lacticaseibacillus kribbianus]